MKSDLTDLETAILTEIARANSRKYPLLAVLLRSLRVESREFTGVGMYVNFVDAGEVDARAWEGKERDVLLSSDKELRIDGLKYDVTYVLSLSKGRPEHLELVTNGSENWDGTYAIFSLIDSETG